MEFSLCRFINKLLLVTILGSYSVSFAEVWSDTEVWSQSKEAEYNNWVKTTWTKDFFSLKFLPNSQTPNPFHGLRVDCADAVYSMRIIYSYLHNLPFAINDPTGGSKLITNKMSRFDDIADKNLRVKKFMRFIYNTVSTRSLPADTFSVELNSNWVKPGSLILTTSVNHHSWTVKDILNIGVPWLVFNSIVGSQSNIIIQERKTWPNPAWVFEGNHTPAGHAGFRYWKPIDMLKKPQWEQVGYSDEQYKIPLKKWNEVLQSRLKTLDEKPEDELARLMQVSCEELKGRVAAIQEGVHYLSANSKSCMDYATYDNYSTPSRDQRFYDSLIALRVAYQKYETHNLPPTLQQQLNKIFPSIRESSLKEAEAMAPITDVTTNSFCLTTYSLANAAMIKQMDLAEAKRRMFKGIMSNNPHSTFEYRWGDIEKGGQSDLAKKCPSWDPWKPELQ